MNYKKMYTWKEVEDYLIKILNKSKHILTFGTIGSCNIEHDVDIIITKKTSSCSSNFYREIHDLFDSLNKHLKRYGAKVIRLPSISYQIELLELSHYNKKDLVTHSMIYSSYPQIKKDWDWALTKNKKIDDILKNQNYLLGSFKGLLSENFQKENGTESYFIYLNMYDRLNSNYSEKFLVKVMSYYYNLILKNMLKLKPIKLKNKKEVKEFFYKLCDLIDKKR